MKGTDWISSVVEAIEKNPGEPRLNGEVTPGYLRSVIAAYCPFKQETAYMAIRPIQPGHVYDWAAKAAEYLSGDTADSTAHVAAVIATFAEPIVALLQQSRREHFHDEENVVAADCCCARCDCEDHVHAPNGPCTCGADEWNAKIDAALAGAEK